MFKFIARLFASNPIAEEPVSKRKEWLLLKRAAEKSGSPVLCAAMRAAAQQGYDLMVEQDGRKSMLYPTYEGLEKYCGLCLNAFGDTERATLRPEVRVGAAS